MPQNGPRGHDSIYEKMIIHEFHILGQMHQNGPRGHDSIYENMISMDLQESPPEYSIYTFLARCPRTASEAMILFTKT